MCMPRILSVVLSARIFTMPSLSIVALAREFAEKGNTPWWGREEEMEMEMVVMMRDRRWKISVRE